LVLLIATVGAKVSMGMLSPVPALPLLPMVSVYVPAATVIVPLPEAVLGVGVKKAV